MRLRGERIDNLPPEEMRKVRGKRIGMVFQDPLTSLNPLYRIGDQLDRDHPHAYQPVRRAGARSAPSRCCTKSASRRRRGASTAIRTSSPAACASAWCWRWRLCAEPELLIADEPTTALDVSVQAQIIALLKRLCREHGTAVMLITHDMGVIAETADRVAVMYAGRIAEIGPVRDVVQAPAAPLHQGPDGRDPVARRAMPTRLVQIPGSMPRLSAIPPGCAFHPRCPYAFDRCRVERPELQASAARRSRAGSAIRYRSGEPTRGRVTDGAPREPSAACRGAGPRRVFDVSKPWLNRVIEGGAKPYLKAVAGVSFAIDRRETFALVGESGSGKSTVARMVVGLLPPTGGEVSIDGVSM